MVPKKIEISALDARFFRGKSLVKSFSVIPCECHSQRFGTPKPVSNNCLETSVRKEITEEICSSK